MSTSKSSVWFITGASKGFGLQITRDALQRGDSVVATARDPETITAALGAHERLYALPLDVTVEAQANERAKASAFSVCAPEPTSNLADEEGLRQRTSIRSFCSICAETTRRVPT